MADEDKVNLDQPQTRRKAASVAAAEQAGAAGVALQQDTVNQTLENLAAGSANITRALDPGPALRKHLPYQTAADDSTAVATHPYGSPSRTFDPATGEFHTVDALNRDARKDLPADEPGAPRDESSVYLGKMTPGAAPAPASATFGPSEEQQAASAGA
jgi:hypothetical protein